MADYRKMYLHLFTEMTKVIQILQEAQQAAEEMFIAADDTPLALEEKNQKTLDLE